MSDSKNRKTLVQRINESGALVSGLALFLMMLIGAFDVILSKVFNSPIPGTFESTEALMAVSCFLAIAYNQQRKGHIRVELFTSRFPLSLRSKFDLFAHFLSVAFFFILSWQAWKYGWESLKVGEYESGLINFPIYPAKLLIALGASMMTLQCLQDLWSTVTKMTDRVRSNT